MNCDGVLLDTVCTLLINLPYPCWILAAVGITVSRRPGDPSFVFSLISLLFGYGLLSLRVTSANMEIEDVL